MASHPHGFLQSFQAGIVGITSFKQEARHASLVAVKMWALSRSGSILLGTRSKVHGRLQTLSATSNNHENTHTHTHTHT